MPPDPPADAAAPLIYRIDGANRLVWFNEAWIEAARQHGGGDQMPARMLGSDLLEAMSDPTVRELHAAMIRHVRAGKTVRYDYRCDTPDQRRLFGMEIRPRPDGEVEFATVLRQKVSRPPLRMLLAGLPRAAERYVRICSWCQRVAMPDGRWLDVELAVAESRLLAADPLPRITHGICEDCEARVMAALGGG